MPSLTGLSKPHTIIQYTIFAQTLQPVVALALVGACKAVSHLEFKAPNSDLDLSPSCGGFGLQAVRGNEISPRDCWRSIHDRAGWSPSDP